MLGARKAREKQRAEVVVALSNLRGEFVFPSGFAIFEVWKVSISKFGKCHFRSESFHYSHFVGKVRQFGSIVGKIESHVQELQILLFLTKVTASETENAILPKQLRTKTPTSNNLNFRKLVLWEIGTSKEEEFGKIAVSVFNAVSTGV